MNSLVRRAARLGVAVLAAAAALTPHSTAAAAVDPFVVVNSSSFQGPPVPRGALLSIFTTNRVSAEQGRTFDPWAPNGAPDGLFVAATCGADGSLKHLPLLFVGHSGDGTQINVYYPNSKGPEPFGTCADAGMSEFWVHPAPGFGEPMMIRVETVTAHPGIFSVSDAPSGNHVDSYSGAATPIATCNKELPDDPVVCPVRHHGEPAEVWIQLTGADALVCNPCAGGPVIVELAPVVNGVTGTYVPHYLGELHRDSTGVEKARIFVNTDTPRGEYRLRIRNTLRPEFPPPLRVEFGSPIG